MMEDWNGGMVVDSPVRRPIIPLFHDSIIPTCGFSSRHLPPVL
jgi:hypothetical protein